MKKEKFKKLVAESIDELPEEFRKKMQNVNTQKSIERLCRNENEIKEKVRAVFMHELGHHFGMSEKDLSDN